MAIYFETPAALILSDSIFTKREKEGAGTALAQTRVFERKSLNPSLRFSLTGEPGRPNLRRLAARIVPTSVPARTAQQVTEPPGTAAIGQTEPQKPYLITSAHRELREGLVERFHGPRRITSTGAVD